MRALKVLALVAAVALAIHWWRGRSENVDATETSPNGFVSVMKPESARRDTVLIFAPLNCRSDAAYRADTLAQELRSRGIPNARRDTYNWSMTNPTADDEKAIKRTYAVMNAGAPFVVINGKAKANPTLKEVVAEYRGIHQD